MQLLAAALPAHEDSQPPAGNGLGPGGGQCSVHDGAGDS
jgi:hypothetical protein